MASFKKSISLALILILIMSFLAGCSTPSTNTEEGPQDNSEESLSAGNENEVELLISAAASLTDVLNELGDIYKEISPNTKLNFTYGSSGALQAQIEEGAPVDVFFSAAEKQMDALAEGSHIVEDSRKTLLINKVVLISPANSDLEVHSFDDLTNSHIEKIAIGDPSNVPVGQYTEEIFTNLNLLDNLQEKLVYANDVRTVLTWVENEEVHCGLVYATDAFTSEKVKIISEAPENSHKAVTYPVAVIKDSKNIEESQGFIDFLSSQEAIDVFEKYGFEMN